MASILKDYNTMGLPMNITRGNPIPVDSTEIWYSLEEAQDYALNGKTAYVGQSIKVVDEAAGTVTNYTIGVDGSLIKKPNIVEDDSNEFNIADGEGNIIAKVDSQGIHTTEMDLGGMKVKETVSDNISRISALEARIFMGTQEQYNVAYAKGEISIGTIVILLEKEIEIPGDSGNEGNDPDTPNEGEGNDPDTPNEGESEDKTSSKLGTGVLGYMILGNKEE